MHAVLGKIVSGVVVPTTMNPIWSGRDPGLSHRPDRRFLRQVGGRDARLDDVALLDAGALEDPLVGRLDQLLEIVIRQQLRRHEGRQTRDLDAPQTREGAAGPRYSVTHHKRSFPGAGSPKYSYARGVATRPRGVRSRNPI